LLKSIVPGILYLIVIL